MTTKEKAALVIDIYDPAMCCSTGVCGTDVDDSLADFASDVKWLKTQGIEVNRYNLGQEPEIYKANPAVLSRLKSAGTDILPIIFVNGDLVSEGGYPDRRQLLEWVYTDNAQDSNDHQKSSNTTEDILFKLEQAVTIGDNVELRSLYQKGETYGVLIQLMVQAMQAGINNRQKATQSILQTANELLGVQPGGCKPGGGCC